MFPPFLVLASRLGRRFALRAVIFAAIANFALCEVAAVHSLTTNFYLAPTRAWELLVGSACAFIGEQPQDRKGTAAGWLGFASIVAAIFLFSDDIPFPSHFAAAPVIGTALILVYARPESGIGRVLALPPFVGVGLISYSFYLWHQPLFAFARLRSRDEPGMATMLSLAVFALVLAWATWRFIERPFRRHDYTRQQQRRAAVLFGCSLAVFGAVGTYGIATDSVRWRLRPNLDPAVVELAATRELRKLPSPTCPPGFGDDAVPCLILPPPPGGRTVALFGDSLAEASLPAFLAAARAERVGLVFGFASGCPPFPGIYVYDGNYRPERCGERAMEEMEAARRFRADTVFLVARWTLYNESAGISRFHYWLTREPAPSSPTLAQSREVFAEALPRTVTAYRAQNQQVVLVRQLPQFELDVGRFVERLRYSEVRAANLPALTFAAGRSRTEFDNLAARSNRVLDSQLSKGTRIIDLGAPFTRGDRYVWSDGRESWYFDFAHVSVAGALQLVPQLRGALKANPVGNAPDAATADVRPSP
ncbi:MAG: acyltransferase [Alphaproteobacteria bacterium]|nr:acyltransferase [Alphaproteobacteria bacterium]